MATAGRILIIPKGKYNEETQYELLDLVSHGGKGWICKKTCIGIEPVDGEYWAECLDVSEELNGHTHSSICEGEYVAEINAEGKFAIYKNGESTPIWTPDMALNYCGVNVSPEELSYISGANSNIQLQLDGKASSDHKHDSLEKEKTKLEVLADKVRLTKATTGSHGTSVEVLFDSALMQEQIDSHNHESLKNGSVNLNILSDRMQLVEETKISNTSVKEIIFDSKTHGHSEMADAISGNRVAIQSDGNLVVYDKNNTPIWASKNPLGYDVDDIESGSVGISPTTANSVTSVNIKFNRTFTHAPHVVATPQTSVPNACFASVDQITQTGCRINLYRADAVGTHVHWIAMA
jgi:hypothetical protein